MDIHEVDWNSIPWTQVRPGVERKAFSSERATLSLNRLSPGHEPWPHHHPHEQIVYIVSGRFRLYLGKEYRDMGPGSLLVVPPNVEHWGEVLGDEPVLNLDVFSPRRTEYA
jgi:quercetin dioxygenase-like cupin family protein